uniref:AAA family ATPase n=1 Tax=Sinomonas sp. G460-2 TaxID=3393464 RepID=UPI0039EEB4BE
DEGARRGALLAVWGPLGSPGRTTIAVNIAAELVADGQRVVLVDADTFGPSVAAHLGLLDESAGIAQACRLADQGTLDAEALGRVAATVVTTAGALLVLTGLTRADRWPELRAASFAAVLAQCREIADTVVVDVGFSLEADEEFSFDTMAPRRNAATLRALENADRVIAVGAADAVGMPRLVRGLNELERAVPAAMPDVVFNKIRRGTLGRFPERALREAWERFGPNRPIAALVPYDADTADAALLGGDLLLESAPHSALRRAIAGIVCSPVQQNRRSAVASARALAKRSR